MNAPALINKALLARGLMPMDGDCSCASCGKGGLNRDDLSASGYCTPCLDDAEGYGSASLNTTYTDGETLTRDYVRGHLVRE